MFLSISYFIFAWWLWFLDEYLNHFKEMKLWEVQPKWWNRKTLNLHSPTVTPKLQLFTEQLSMTMTWILPEIYKEVTTMKWRGRAKTQYSQDPHSWVGDSQTRGSQVQRFSPMSEGSELHIRLRTSGVLHWEDGPPEHLAVRANRACIWESRRAVGNIDPILTGHMQNLTCSESQCRGSNLKVAWVRLTYWS